MVDKKKNGEIRRFFAGMFLVLGVFLLFFVIFLLGKDKGLTQSKFQVTVLYRDVGGLMEGAPVRFSGVNVGHVAEVSFLDKEVNNRRIKVILNILSKYQSQLSKQVDFIIQTEGILGDKLIDISVVDDSVSIDLDKPIFGKEAMEVEELAGVFAAAAESFKKTAEDINKIDMQGLSEVVEDTAQSLSKTAKSIDRMTVEIDYVMKKSKRLLNRIEEKIIEGTLFKVF